jgi:hypothetical protein
MACSTCQTCGVPAGAVRAPGSGMEQVASAILMSMGFVALYIWLVLKSKQR